MTLAAELAGLAAETASERVPPAALDNAAILVANTLASAAVGSRLASAIAIRRLETDRGGVADASVWFGGGARLPLAATARVNAVMSDAAAFDDSDLRNMAHPGTTAVACALSVAEKTGAAGVDLLAAIALGYEVSGRINAGLIPGLREKGFHGCIVAAFAGAAAAGRLLRLDRERMTHAIALTATSMGGIMAAAKTSAAREYHGGLAAMLGMDAALSAASGYIGATDILEAPLGFFDVFGEGPTPPNLLKVLDKVGADWQILTNMGIKLMPGVHNFHAMVEAAILASEQSSFTVDDVAAIAVAQPGMTALPGPRYPTDRIGLIHSACYFVAVAVAQRRFTPEHVSSMEHVSDPSVQALLARVQVGELPAGDLSGWRVGASVTITLKDGRSFSQIVPAPKGAAIRGIDWGDVSEKYRSLLQQTEMQPDAIEESLARVRALAGARDAGSLARLMGHAPGPRAPSKTP